MAGLAERAGGQRSVRGRRRPRGPPSGPKRILDVRRHAGPRRRGDRDAGSLGHPDRVCRADGHPDTDDDRHAYRISDSDGIRHTRTERHAHTRPNS